MCRYFWQVTSNLIIQRSQIPRTGQRNHGPSFDMQNSLACANNELYGQLVDILDALFTVIVLLLYYYCTIQTTVLNWPMNMVKLVIYIFFLKSEFVIT